MSDTPETDAVAEKINFGVDIDFARKLERERDEAREAFVIATDQMVVAQGKVREANKERDEALIDRTNGDIATMTINHYERILRERDEVKEKYRWAVIHWQIGSAKMERERDEAREALKHIEEYGTEEINAAVDLRQKLASALVEREEWKNKAYSHATDYTLMEAKCFRLEQQLKEYDKLKS